MHVDKIYIESRDDFLVLWYFRQISKNLCWVCTMQCSFDRCRTGLLIIKQGGLWNTLVLYCIIIVACLEIPQSISFLCRQATWVLFFEGWSWNINCNRSINNKNTGRKHLTKSSKKNLTGYSFLDWLRNFLHKFTWILLSLHKLNKLGKFW